MATSTTDVCRHISMKKIVLIVKKKWKKNAQRKHWRNYAVKKTLENTLAEIKKQYSLEICLKMHLSSGDLNRND